MGSRSENLKKKVTEFGKRRETIIDVIKLLTREEVRPIDIARELKIDKRIVHKYLKKAMRYGWVTRKGRGVWRLTNEGKRQVELIEARRELTNEGFYQLFDEFMIKWCNERDPGITYTEEYNALNYLFGLYIIGSFINIAWVFSKLHDIVEGSDSEEVGKLINRELDKYWVNELREIAKYIGMAYICSSDEAYRRFHEFFYWIKVNTIMHMTNLYQYLKSSQGNKDSEYGSSPSNYSS